MNLGQLQSREEWVQRWGQIARDDWRSGRMAADPNVPETALSRMSAPYGIVSQLRRKLTVLDLIPTAIMESASFAYTPEGGSFDTAAETAELQLKPEADISLPDATCHARTIAHYLKVARQQLDDISGLATSLNTRLSYGVERRLETQILSGDGTGENIMGILNTTGIGAPASATGDTVNADLLLNGIVSVLNAAATPTAVVMNPADQAPALKAKSAGSGMRLDSMGAFVANVGDEVWNVPVVLNLGIPKGTALVGDFAMGATLSSRETTPTNTTALRTGNRPTEA
jgi:HK97 family phage major capsid protein